MRTVQGICAAFCTTWHECAWHSGGARPWRTATSPTACAGWFRSRSQWRALRHLCSRARLDLALLDELDLVNRTAELAKTFGIDWYSVISRGSQYRVESMLARLAHTQNFLLVRPRRHFR